MQEFLTIENLKAHWLKITIAIVGSALVVVATVGGFYYYSVNVKKDITTPLVLKVEKGDGVSAVLRKGQEVGLISSPLIFEAYVYLKGYESKIKAGEYVFVGPTSMPDIISSLMKGDKKIGTKKITIPEGWNINDIDKYLTDQGMIEKGQYAKTANDSNFVASLKNSYDFFTDLPSGASLEGYLFPDTYSVFANASVDEIIRKQLSNFNAKYSAALREASYKQGKTMSEVITLASIVEKEVRKTEDMKVVAGIFQNRLKNGQPLQSCATLAYILGVNKPQYSIEDTKVNSPYNTYQFKGLTPGPISNPGLNAIEAVIYPTKTNYQFFLTANGTGETVFAETYDQHLINKAKYLQ